MHHDVIVVGAGAAGLMCAITAAERGRKVLVLDHANKAGKKILLSGGGRCNFTNRYAAPENYLSHNPHFCISALKRYTQYDFEALVHAHDIAYHEKTLGQLFCDESAKDMTAMLLGLLQKAGAALRLKAAVTQIEKNEQFCLQTSMGDFSCQSLVIATGGLSFPTMGATAFGYQVAEQFGLNVLPVRAALVPLTLHKHDLAKFSELSGVSLDVTVSCGDQTFHEAMLFTHRGLSGPAILQISSYWQPGQAIHINLLPGLTDVSAYLIEQQQKRPDAMLKTILEQSLPKRFAQVLCEYFVVNKPMKQYNDPEVQSLAKQLTCFEIRPNGTEGYRTAEVTIGGVDTNEISSKTFEANKVPGLYFIGEVLDITGHLGGFNFQWAWSSGHCCGQYV